MNRHRKYERAWDIIDNRWKTPEEVDYAIMHDKPRFISEKPNNMGDGGYILTLYKAYTRKDKSGKPVNVRAQFKQLKTLSLNTYENRQRIEAQEIRRESEVHKLCKELFENKSIISMHVDKRSIPIVVGNSIEYIDLGEQIITILEVEATEKRDAASNKIPDIIVKAMINGFVQRFFIEIYYRHPVDQYKRFAYTQNKINCLEVDIGNVYEELKDKNSQAELRNKLIHIITTQAQWISCNIEEEIKASLKYNYNIINSSTILRRSKHEILDGYNFAYIFRDDLVLLGKDRVQRYAHNIGDCIDCNRCIGIKGHHSWDVDSVEVLCSKQDIPEKLSDEEKALMVKNSIKDWVARYAENIT